MRVIHAALLAGCGCLAIGPSLFAQDLDWRKELLGRTPSDVNLAAVIQLQELLQTPRGLKEGWAEKYESGYLSGAVAIPPTVQTALIAAELNWAQTSDSETFSLVLLKQPAKQSLPQFVAREKGVLDTFDNRSVALTRRHGYVVPYSSRVFGAMTPPNRQHMARWLRDSLVPSPPRLSPYLAEALTAKDAGQVTAALDTNDLFHESDVMVWLKHATALADKKIELPPLAKTLARLRGVRFSAQVRETTKGELRFDFSSAPQTPPDLLKAILVEWIEEIGAAIPELRDSQARLDRYGLVLEMELSDDSLRRIMSLIYSPTALIDSPATAAAEGMADTQASAKYYHTVFGYLEAVTRMNQRASDYHRTSVWHDSYARRIEGLDTAGVDGALVQWGSAMANYLRGLASSLRGEGLNMNLLAGQARVSYQPIPWYTVRYGAWGFQPGTAIREDNFSQIRAAQAQAISKGAGERDEVWKRMIDETKTIQQQMQEKYKVDFATLKKPGA